MIWRFLTLGLALLGTVVVRSQAPSVAARVERAVCPRCAWQAPGGPTVNVRTIGELERAIADAKSGQTILLADGDYALRQSLHVATPGVTVRGRNGDPGKVVLHGRGMVNDPVGVAFSIGAADVTLADFTIREVGFHAIQVRGEHAASRFTLHNARLENTGQQLLKGSVSFERRYADDGLIACSEFRYTASAPSNYTNGVDLLATKGWHIRDNRFERIRGPESQGWSAGPAILVWAASEDTVVERNLVIDSYRGIALGLSPDPGPYARNGEKAFDHLRGVIRNNVVVNLNRWGDEGIEANAAPNARIDHNTVVTEGSIFWSISVRFPAAPSLVRNNLTTRRILLRDGGRGTLEGNVSGAMRNWFVGVPTWDYHLSSDGARAIDAGVHIADVTEDFDRRPRVTGLRPDAGAFEWRQNRHPW